LVDRPVSGDHPAVAEHPELPLIAEAAGPSSDGRVVSPVGAALVTMTLLLTLRSVRIRQSTSKIGR
jgi:hypothetical protein